ncbi:hypothetical protein [Nocardia sp. NPDC050710]|uniref:hypothetical protein n=1 Tax=Nocardia sp. NPDC050710 TaxID=3157220 RepID=UPI0033FAC175
MVAGRPGPEPGAVGVAATAPSTTPAGDRVPLRVLAGEWTGSYFCSQGETALTLTLDPPDGAGSRAVFGFGPSPANPGIPIGAFEMGVGYLHNVLTFTQRRWITRPGDYLMVDLVADDVSPSHLSGRVTGPGCTIFQVTRRI